MNNIIKVKRIDFVNPKDMIEVTSKEDFEKLNIKLFSGEGIIFNLDGTYYLITSEVAYIFKERR